MFVYPRRYDVVVVGAGHAGVEAALAASRLGCSTLLLTANLDTVAQMSCNPAIGGAAKGQLVREIDAMGGWMAKTTDMTGLQFRLLNRSRGPAVRAPRAQCDKKAYQFRMKWLCESQDNLDIKQGQAVRIAREGDSAAGVETDLGVRFTGASVILTTGTFLQGLLHFGMKTREGGRAGDAPAIGMSASLRELGIELRRLKTGTPPRLLRRSIDFSRTEVQPGDEPVPFFSFCNEELFHVEHPGENRDDIVSDKHRYPAASVLANLGCQLPCHLTATTAETTSIVRSNLERSPLYSGVIEGRGPRYCPSIEDKVMRFPDRPSHQIFLEPEGIHTEEIYLNGLSTSLPIDVQVALVRSVIGCERAEITRPAYAVEYDSACPTQLYPSLESKCLQGLFLAGQINGTSGYEEAAAQGLMAGINAARRVQGRQPVVLRRDQAYIGVLIDDIISKGPTEPYRLFSSRAEFRLILRQDNADLRLCGIGREIGLLGDDDFSRFVRKRALIDLELARLSSTRHGSQTLAELLKRSDITYSSLPSIDPALTPKVAEEVEIIVKYEGYVQRQQEEVTKAKSLESKLIPDSIDYHAIVGLGTEARQELSKIRPANIGQASRIAGVTPADISLLLVRMKTVAT
jgi:tRNA uridine 5-carboxymethylaminomethyl modification enzyme